MTKLFEKTDIALKYPFEFSGYRVFIIGGGTSLIDFDFSMLWNEVTIGCNKAAFEADTNILVSIDRNFISNYHGEIQEHVQQGGLAVLGRRTEEDLNRVAAIIGATDCRHLREPIIDPPEMCLAGPNSGFAALGLAVQSRATEIHLLGFDMCGGKHGKHFFGHYRHGTSPPTAMQNWHRAFDACADEIRNLRISVTNWVGEPRSRIECFPTRPLEELKCLL